MHSLSFLYLWWQLKEIIYNLEDSYKTSFIISYLVLDPQELGLQIISRRILLITLLTLLISVVFIIKNFIIKNSII